jgi:hypothetical protein
VGWKSPAVATTAAVAASTSSPITAASTATTASFARGCLVHPDHAAHPLHILEVIDRLLLGGVIVEFNKGKTSFPTGVAIEGESALANLPVLGEKIEEIFTFGLERKITDVNGH